MAGKVKNKVTTKAPTRQMWRRSVVVLVILILFCIGIIGKLSIIQIAQADFLREEAVKQQMRDSFISPKRGTIYDTNMTVLSLSATVWTVIMSPKDITDEGVRVKIADELSELLEVDRDKLYEKTLKVNSQYEVVKPKIEYPLAQTLSTWIQDNKLTGVFRIIEDYKRYYPLNNLASAVLGFTGTDNNGLYGLEAYYEKTLAGKPGRIVTAKNGWGDDMPNKLKFEKTVDAQDGNSLVLTIDSVVQYYAEKHLEIAVKETGCTNRGSVIVMEVDTGAIIAMATKGDFDPNEPMTITDPDDLTKIALLSGDERAAAVKKAREEQWVNKPISDFYEPGSVFKTFTAAMALEEGRIPDNWSYYCKGSIVAVPGTKKINCHKYGGHGSQNFSQVLSNSCNPAFVTVGLDLGRTLFYKYFTGFGFTDRTGIDMLSESKVTDLLFHDESELGPIQLAVSAFGQTFKVTPIQMITAMSAVANGGKLMQPYVVQQILDAQGNVISNTQPVVKRQVISESSAAKLNKMMADSVIGGGAKNSYIAGYRMAGKTGTSVKTDQKNTQGTDNVIASFSGFAPADDPKYAILVMLDEPQTAIRFGGTLAAPVAQKIFSEALPYLGVEPKYTEEEIAAMDRTTPSVKGKKVSVARTMLSNLNLQCHVVGNGDTVIKQVPDKGESIPRNGTVVLYTDETELSKTTVVPDFTGKTMSQANIAAANARINIQISGLGLESGEAKASKQSIEAGQQVPLGTVVKVDFVYEDQIR
ncbi:MAG: penicillin-binding transpeptidase domain-containing protein [Oscillospiraceae bacterium]|nr:penicillin-binding transpeptidase domain-containing protein [Oscillospiraceae bacterium]